METEYNKVVVVDENDTIIGAEYMMDAIEKGLLRRAARICVFNKSGQLLVQRRSKNVHRPLLLDLSAGGHVDEGETNEAAAYRELKEELGINGYTLTLVTDSYRTTGFYSALYKVVIPDETPIKFDHEELETVHWYDIEVLCNQLQTHPEKFAPAIRETWSQFGEQIVRE